MAATKLILDRGDEGWANKFLPQSMRCGKLAVVEGKKGVGDEGALRHAPRPHLRRDYPKKTLPRVPHSYPGRYCS